MSGHLAKPSGRPLRFKLVSPVLGETSLQESVVAALDLLLLPPAEYTAFPAGSVPLPPQFAAKLYRMGLKRGWPDVLIVFQGIWGLELKRPGGKLSKTRTVRTRSGALRTLLGQEDVHPRLLLAGFRDIAVADSLSGALDVVRGWGIPLRRTT